MIQRLVESMPVTHALWLFAAAVIGGAINSVAGGGTLITFPSLLAIGTNPLIANATSTVALWPGSLGGMWGYRRELARSERWLFWLGLPSVFGGTAGAVLLRWTPAATFTFIVPYLILFATFLFMIQEPIRHWLERRGTRTSPSPAWITVALVCQWFVALYGGYFGAGIGILMLSVLGLLGIRDIHEMNGLKTLFAMCINGMAAGCFVLLGLVDWSQACVMIVGSIVGGYFGAHFARRLGTRTVRLAVILIGCTIGTVMLYQQLRG